MSLSLNAKPRSHTTTSLVLHSLTKRRLSLAAGAAAGVDVAMTTSLSSGSSVVRVENLNQNEMFILNSNKMNFIYHRRHLHQKLNLNYCLHQNQNLFPKIAIGCKQQNFFRKNFRKYFLKIINYAFQSTLTFLSFI